MVTFHDMGSGHADNNRHVFVRPSYLFGFGSQFRATPPHGSLQTRCRRTGRPRLSSSTEPYRGGVAYWDRNEIKVKFEGEVAAGRDQPRLRGRSSEGSEVAAKLQSKGKRCRRGKATGTRLYAPLPLKHF